MTLARLWRRPQSGRVLLLTQRVLGVSAGMAAAQLVASGTYVIGARSLGPSRFGAYMSVLTATTVATVVLDFGLGSFLVREVAASHISLGFAMRALWYKRSLVLLTAPGVGAVAMLVLRDTVTAAAIATTFVVTWEAQMARNLLRAQERFRTAAVAQIAGRSAGLCLVLLLTTALNLSSVALALGVAASFAVEAGVARVGIGRTPTAGTPGWRAVLGLQRQAYGYGLGDLVGSSQQADTPLVAIGGGFAAAGVYAAAGRLIGPLIFLSTSLYQVAAPWLARVRDDHAALRREERAIRRLALVLAGAPLLAALAGPPLISLLLGHAYSRAGIAFAILAGGAVLQTINGANVVIVQNRGLQVWSAVAMGVGLSVGLAATLLLAAIGGAVLAAWGYAVTHALILSALWYRIRRLPPLVARPAPASPFRV